MSEITKDMLESETMLTNLSEDLGKEDVIIQEDFEELNDWEYPTLLEDFVSDLDIGFEDNNW